MKKIVTLWKIVIGSTDSKPWKILQLSLFSFMQKQVIWSVRFVSQAESRYVISVRTTKNKTWTKCRSTIMKYDLWGNCHPLHWHGSLNSVQPLQTGILRRYNYNANAAIFSLISLFIHHIKSDAKKSVRHHIIKILGQITRLLLFLRSPRVN